MYDIIILGAGPAGMSAAVYLARKKLKTLILTKDLGGQTAMSGKVENYLGFKSISGAELSQRFYEHVQEYKDFVEIHMEEPASDLSKQKNGKFLIKTKTGEYSSICVIIASGKLPKKLNVPGENKLLKRGVTYCATCDAPLFTKKDVAIIGGGNSAMDAGVQLMRIANKVHIITINEELMGDSILKEMLEKANNVSIIKKAQITQIYGEKSVEGIKVNADGKQKDIKVKGVFIEIGSYPSVQFAKDIEKNQYNEIRLIKGERTNIEGIFACGDVTEVAEKQTIIAAGDGAKAAIQAYE